MVAVFRRVTAELSADFIQKFSCQFDVNAMLEKICEDNNLDITYQNQNFVIHGDWNGLGRAHSMFVSALAVYGSPTEMENKSLASRPFSALVEAAEAISREVELQEQVKNEGIKINQWKTDSNASVNRLQFNKTDDTLNGSENDSSSIAIVETSGENEIETNFTKNPKIPDSACISSNENSLSLTEDHETYQGGIENLIHISSSSLLLGKKSDEQEVTNNLGDVVHVAAGNFSNSTSKYKKNEFMNIDPENLTDEHLSKYRKAKKNEMYECEICKKHYKKWKSLVEHLKSHYQISLTQETTNDDLSNKVMPSSDTTSETRTDDAVKKKKFLCQKCGKSYTTKHTLMQHVNTHLGIKPYQCTVCGKTFTYETALRDHRYTHNDAKYFICQFPKCEKAFRQRSALKMHEKIHADIKQFCCTECGRGFTQKHALQRHERSHKGQKPFKCKLCGRMFGDSSIVKRHIKLVHKLNKDNGVWREDIEEVAEETIEYTDKSAGEEIINSEPTGLVEVTAERSGILYDMEKNGNLVPNPIDINCDEKDSEVQSHTPTNNIQSVFVNYNLPEHNVPDPSHEFQEVSVAQHTFKPFVEVNSKLDRQENAKVPITNNLSLLPSEQETYVIERDQIHDQIHFLTENLDGTLNTSTIDFSRLKRNFEHLSKPNSYLDINAVPDQFGETLKPDGTVAELPMDSFENLSRYSDNDQLSEHLGLSLPQFQFYSSSSVNQYLNLNQTSIMPGLPNTETSSSD